MTSNRIRFILGLQIYQVLNCTSTFQFFYLLPVFAVVRGRSWKRLTIRSLSCSRTLETSSISPTTAFGERARRRLGVETATWGPRPRSRQPCRPRSAPRGPSWPRSGRISGLPRPNFARFDQQTVYHGSIQGRREGEKGGGNLPRAPPVRRGPRSGPLKCSL